MSIRLSEISGHGPPEVETTAADNMRLVRTPDTPAKEAGSLSMRERIDALYSWQGHHVERINCLPDNLLQRLETRILEWLEEPEDEREVHLPYNLAYQLSDEFYKTPAGCEYKVARMVDKLIQCKQSDDAAGLESAGHELSEYLSGAGLMRSPRRGMLNAKVDLSSLNDEPLVELDDSKQIEKLDLQWLYDVAPERLKRVIDLLYVIGGRSQELAPVLTMFVYNLAGNLMGKEVVGLNKGRAYYGNVAFIALLDSGANKFFVEVVRQILDRVLDSISRSLPPTVNVMGQEDTGLEVREQVQRDFGLDAGLTTRLLSSGGNVNGVYKLAGRNISIAQFAKLASGESARFRSELKAEMYLDPGALILADEATMTLNKLISAGGGRGALDLGEVLKMFDSGILFDKTVGDSGWQAVNDACVGLIGCSQPEVWNEYISSVVSADTSGLIGRIQVLKMQDCLPVKVTSKRIPQAEAMSQLETALHDLIIYVTHGKNDEGKILCDYMSTEGPEGDWAGELYAEVTAEMGSRYDDLVDRYRFEAEMGCKGKVFWHSIKLAMTLGYFSLKPSEIRSIRSTYDQLITPAEHATPKEQLIYERMHRHHKTELLKDAESFKNIVRLVIGMMEANLINLDADLTVTKLHRSVIRHIKNLGNEATTSNLLKKQIAVKRGGHSQRMKKKELEQELSDMYMAGLLQFQHMETKDGELNRVWYTAVKVSDIK
tara:strand:- start:1823 stop:3970 length:2148 start_codon:yes stop_codon:yes gene_type:complete